MSCLVAHCALQDMQTSTHAVMLEWMHEWMNDSGIGNRYVDVERCENQCHHFHFETSQPFQFVFCSNSCKSTRNKDRHSRDVWSLSAQGLQILCFLGDHHRRLQMLPWTIRQPQLDSDRRQHRGSQTGSLRRYKTITTFWTFVCVYW